MLKMRYLRDVVTLTLDRDRCGGCGMCTIVCPHAVFAMDNSKARIADRDACMECGACARNCPTQAVSVRSGVGCAAALIRGAFRGGQADCGCSGNVPCCGL